MPGPSKVSLRLWTEVSVPETQRLKKIKGVGGHGQCPGLADFLEEARCQGLKRSLQFLNS